MAPNYVSIQPALECGHFPNREQKSMIKNRSSQSSRTSPTSKQKTIILDPFKTGKKEYTSIIINHYRTHYNEVLMHFSYHYFLISRKILIENLKKKLLRKMVFFLE
jgi:hypothetical protein